MLCKTAAAIRCSISRSLQYHHLRIVGAAFAQYILVIIYQIYWKLWILSSVVFYNLVFFLVSGVYFTAVCATACCVVRNPPHVHLMNTLTAKKKCSLNLTTKKTKVNYTWQEKWSIFVKPNPFIRGKTIL